VSTRGRGECRIACHATVELGHLQRPVMELGILGLAALLDQSPAQGRNGARAEFAGPPPAHARALEAALGAPCAFGQAQDALVFPAAWLDATSPLADPAMHALSLGRCREQLRELSGRGVLEAGLRHELFAAGGRSPGLATLAARRNMSARTLIRRLRSAGTSYQRVLDEVRASLAAELLRDTSLPVAEVAHRLGFADPSNFGRAFRSWHGCSPGQFRRRPVAPRAAGQGSGAG